MAFDDVEEEDPYAPGGELDPWYDDTEDCDDDN
jgi:hypothetical protein